MSIVIEKLNDFIGRYINACKNIRSILLNEKSNSQNIMYITIALENIKKKRKGKISGQVH